MKIKKFWLSLDRVDKAMIIVLILSFAVRIMFLFYSPVRGWDETIYLNLGHDLSSNPLSYSLKNAGWSDFIPSNDPIYGWPNIGFRAPLLPYIISLFYFVKMSFLIPFLIPTFAALSVYLVYILGKNLFNKEVGLYSSMIFSVVPIHLLCSEKVWSDVLVVFFMLLTFISFWIGYEKNNKKHKVLFGVFLALSILSRYTAMWLVPVFLLFFIFRDRSIKFLKDKYLWFGISAFALILIPWLIYGYVYYGNPIGSFIHGFKASTYWGGVQSWNYFFKNFWRIFSAIAVLFVPAFLYVFYKKDFLKREVYLLLTWVILFFAMAMYMPHKEDRYILLAVPVISLISGYFILSLKKFKYVVLGLVCIVSFYSFFIEFKGEYVAPRNKSVVCFVEGNKFLSKNIGKDSLVMSNQSPQVHYYSNKKVVPYPRVNNFLEFKDYINNSYKNDLYIFFANYDMAMDSNMKKDLDNNFEKVYECSQGDGYSTVYRYK